MRRGMRALFTALAELGLTLCEATYFLLPDDRFNARAWALQKLKDERARAYFERLDMLAADPRMRQTFDVETVGILNRVEEFTSSAAIRRVFGQRKGIDLREAMDEATWCSSISPAAPRSTKKRVTYSAAFFCAPSCTTPNAEPIIDRALFGWTKGTGISPAISPFCSKRSASTRSELPSPTRISHSSASRVTASAKQSWRCRKRGCLFRLNSMAEATQLAPEVVKLNLEMPVHLLVKPTVVGDQLVTLRNGATSTSTGTTDTLGTGVTDSAAETDTVGENWGTAHTKGVTITEGRSVALGEAETTGTTRSVTTTVGGAETDTDTTSESHTSSRGGSHSDDSSFSDSSGRSTSYTRSTDPASTEWGDRTDSARFFKRARPRQQRHSELVRGGQLQHRQFALRRPAAGRAPKEWRIPSPTPSRGPLRIAIAEPTARPRPRVAAAVGATPPPRGVPSPTTPAMPFHTGSSQSAGWGEAYRACLCRPADCGAQQRKRRPHGRRGHQQFADRDRHREGAGRQPD